MGFIKKAAKFTLTGGLSAIPDTVKYTKYGTTKRRDIKTQKELRKQTSALNQIAAARESSFGQASPADAHPHGGTGCPYCMTPNAEQVNRGTLRCRSCGSYFAAAVGLRLPASSSSVASTATSLQPSEDMVSALERLSELHHEGALTDWEFGRAKNRLLGSIPSDSSDKFTL